MKNKLKVGIYGVSGCAGCLLEIIFSENFKDIIRLVDIKSFPLIKQDKYKEDFDYVLVEGTVCFDRDILVLNELRKKTKYLVALGSCACFGGVPSIKNFLDEEKTMKFVYPRTSHLKSTPPTPLHNHVKVDYYIPQCPPDKDEILEFFKSIVEEKEFRPYSDPVCFECRRKGNLCLLEQGKICLGPITNGGCKAVCPSNSTNCYGCRGPCNDANYKSLIEILKQKGFTQKQIEDKIKTFAGLAFKEKGEKISEWLEK